MDHRGVLLAGVLLAYITSLDLAIAGTADADVAQDPTKEIDNMTELIKEVQTKLHGTLVAISKPYVKRDLRAQNAEPMDSDSRQPIDPIREDDLNTIPVEKMHESMIFNNSPLTPLGRKPTNRKRTAEDPNQEWKLRQVNYDGALNKFAANDLLKETAMALYKKLSTFQFAPLELQRQTVDLENKQVDLESRMKKVVLNPQRTKAEINALRLMVSKLSGVLGDVMVDQANISGSIAFGKHENLFLKDKVLELENALETMEIKFKASPPVQTIFHNQRTLKSIMEYIKHGIHNLRGRLSSLELHNLKMDAAISQVKDRKENIEQLTEKIMEEVKTLRNVLQQLQDPKSQIHEDKNRQMHEIESNMNGIQDVHTQLKQLSRHSADETLRMLKKLEAVQEILKANKPVSEVVKDMIGRLLKNDEEMTLTKKLNHKRINRLRSRFRDVLSGLQMRELSEMETVDRLPEPNHL